MLKLDSIADAWKYYLEGVHGIETESQREKLRIIFYDGFGIALHFWAETHGAPDTFEILQKEYISQVKEKTCAKD